MAGFKIYFTDVALKNLKRFPAKDRAIIIEKIKALAENPLAKTNVVKLVDFDISYRLRAGKYRVLFERNDDLKSIDIIDILPRRKAYRRR
jgi:mRNA interferase RelE/StbE